MSKLQTRKGAPKSSEQQQLTPLEKVRAQCLKRGMHGIRSFARSFKIYDDDGNKELSKQEFNKGLNDYGVKLTEEEKDQMFDSLDEDGTGHLDFDEFLAAMRPPMSEARKKLINQAFEKADATGDGIITIEDLKGIYNVDKHPKYLNGEKTKDECLGEFLKSFDSRDPDGKVTQDEFTSYYEHVGHSVDNDAYFDLMMRNSWNI